MSEYKEKIVNVLTGEETWRNYTAKEIAAVEAAQLEAAAEVEAVLAAQAARQAVLDKLGLTADEVAALGL
jgi:hypothetical protein